MKKAGLNVSAPASAGRSEPEFKCRICRDAGIVHPVIDGKVRFDQAVPCQCQAEIVAREKQQRFMRFCRLPELTEHMTLENFRTDGNPTLEEALGLAKALADGSQDVLWLILLAGVDRGKTHLAVAICRRRLERGLAARYEFVPQMLGELRDGFELEGEQSYRMKMNMLCNVSLLVLDDIGTEKSTEWGREQLLMIVHRRGINGLPLVVTTNKELDRIVGDDTEDQRVASKRIASRLQRETWCRVVVIDAPEHRLR